MRKADPRKILVLRLSSIGDIVLTTPVLRALRRRFPRARIDYLVKARYAQLLSENPHLDRVLCFPDTAGLPELWDTLRRLRRERYDLLVDLHKNWRTAMLRMGTGAAERLAYRKYALRRAFYVLSKKPSFGLPGAVDRYFEAVVGLGVEDDGRGLELHVGSSTQRLTEAKLHRLGWSGTRAIALVPGAGYFTKRWPAERYAQLADRLATRFGCQIFVLGDQEDRLPAALIAGRLDGDAVVDLSSHLSLAESAAALRCCDLVVANDTGLMHMAAALGKKLVAIFGSTTEGLGFFPRGEKVRVIQAELACRPCSHLGRKRCPKGHFRCMREISVDQVFSAAAQLLGATQPVTSSIL